MKKITKYPKTKKEFQHCHVKQWQKIIEILDNEELRMSLYSTIGIKEKAIKDCFSFSKNIVALTCFACRFKTEKSGGGYCYNGCLLKTENSSAVDCLDGDYGRFSNNFRNEIYNRAIYYAKKIRDKELNPNI